jgi:hypothetical protein
MRTARIICIIVWLLMPLICSGQQFSTPREAYGEWKRDGFAATGWDEGGYVYLVAIAQPQRSGHARAQVGVAVPAGDFSLIVQPQTVRGMPHEREKRKRGKPVGVAKVFKIKADNSGAAQSVASFHEYSIEMKVAPKVNALKISLLRGSRIVGEPTIIDISERGSFSEKVTSLECPCPP